MYNPRLAFPGARLPSQILVSKGSFNALRGLYASRVLVITSSSCSFFSDKENLTKIRADVLEVYFKDWSSDPCLDELENVIQFCNKFKPDLILAVGAGSIIDASKIIWAIYENSHINKKNIFTMSLSVRKKSKFVVVPTTIGSGSEVSSSAIIRDPNTGKKRAIVSHEFIPDLVILDSNFIRDVPYKILCSSVCDALTHAIEGYLSTIENTFADVYAETALQIIQNNFFELEQNESAISKLQVASFMAGVVQNQCLVGLSHAIAHEISVFGVPHGEANGLLMPSVMEVNSKNKIAREKYLKLSSLISNKGKSISPLIDLFEKITFEGGFKKIKNYDISLKEESILSIIQDPVGRFNPEPIDQNKILYVIDNS